MSRIASVVLLVGGAILCVTWLVSPASSSPQTLAPPTTAAPSGRSLDEQTVEPVRLETVAPPSRFVAPSRDPFSSQSRAVPERQAFVVPAPVVPAPAAVRLPLLVAIVRERNAVGVDVFRAALSNDGFDVTMVSAGQLFAGFSIVEIRADGLTLKQPSSSESFVVALR